MGLLGTIIGGWMSARAQKKQNKFVQEQTQQQNLYNREMADLEWQRNQEMWNKQNEYNAPVAQMERFGEAGLNPNLIYGQGSSGNATTLPKYQAPEKMSTRLKPIDYLQVLGAYQDTRLKEAQIDNVKAQRRSLDVKTGLGEIDLKYKDIMNDAILKGKLYQNDIEELKAIMSQDEINKIFRSGANGEYTVENQKMLEEFYKSKYLNAPIETEQKRQNLTNSQKLLEKYNAEIANMNVLKDIRDKEREFLNSGGKFFNPLIQAARLIFGR